MNGYLSNGNGRIDFIKVATLVLLVAVAATQGIAWITGRTETTDDQIASTVAKAIAIHSKEPGHQVMVERVSRIEREMKLQETLDKMIHNQHTMIAVMSDIRDGMR